MRRFSIALLAALLFVGFHGTQHVFAITYAAGWNLVAGPEGSHLSGATGSIFTLQPGDTDYEVFAADSPLRGGYGYWAFFPSGGSITLAGGSNTFSVASIPGQFIMVGNPSQAVVTVSGADTAFTYTPSGGYQNATAIPPGQGAWVMGSQIDLAGSGPTSAPVAAAPPVPAPQPSSAPTLTTFAALKAIALNSADLPGYSLSQEQPLFSNASLAVASYSGIWAVPRRGILVIADALVTGFSPSDATHDMSIALLALTGDPANFSQQRFAVAGIGDTATGLRFNYIDRSGALVEWYAVFFVRGSVTAEIDTIGDSGAGSTDYVISLARIIDARLGGQSPAAAVTTVSAPAAVSQPAAHLFTGSGSGTTETANFSVPTAAAYVCVQASGQSPSGSFGPSISLDFWQASGTIETSPSNFDNGGCKIIHLSDGPGRYYLHIIATAWTNWSITVDAQ